MAKKKTNKGAPAKYDESFAGVLEFFKDDPSAITTGGTISPTKIGKLLGVSRETIRRWTDVTDKENFKQKFTEVYKNIQKSIDADEIKRAMITKAKGFTQVKVVRELDEDGKLIVVKRETVKMAGSEAAAKMVLSNIENKEKPDRWDFTEKTDNTHHHDGLAELLNEIDGTGKKLPGHDEPQTDGRETQEPTMAIE